MNRIFNHVLDDFTALACPFCKRGTDAAYRQSLQVGIWGNIKCENCNKSYEVAHGIDDMFIRGLEDGYKLWAGARVVTRTLSCSPGQCASAELRGVFDRIYNVTPWLSKGGSFLPGGIITKYSPAGFIIVANAPAPHINSNQDIQFTLRIAGRPTGSPPLEAWKELMLAARNSLFHAPQLSSITVVSAIDLFFDGMTNTKTTGERPGIWSLRTRDIVGIKLSKLMRTRYKFLENLVWVRHALAHGQDHVPYLPEEIQEKEREWLKPGFYAEGTEAITPSARFALEISLEAIRCCLRALALKQASSSGSDKNKGNEPNTSAVEEE